MHEEALWLSVGDGLAHGRAGTIDAKELRTAMRAMGVELNADESRALLQSVDLTDSQALDLSVRCSPSLQ